MLADTTRPLKANGIVFRLRTTRSGPAGQNRPGVAADAADLELCGDSVGPPSYEPAELVEFGVQDDEAGRRNDRTNGRRREYYGDRMTLVILGTFYAATVAAGYLVEIIFWRPRPGTGSQHRPGGGGDRRRPGGLSMLRMMNKPTSAVTRAGLGQAPD
jgi:hypothetical protein